MKTPCSVLLWLLPGIVAGVVFAAERDPQPRRYFGIQVVDDQTGRGVPLVELSTVHHTRYYTDSNGRVAFCEPGLMGQKVFFNVRSHGYEFPKDGFGFRGKTLSVEEGGRAELRIKRLNIAERLYRVTGVGIYADSVLLGEPVPIQQPLINAQVAGQDSVMAVPWREKIYWFWGDTNRPRYPLGQFHVSGATSLPPGRGGLDPGLGIDLDYFADREGFSRPMCPMPGPHPVWIEGLCIVRDSAGAEHMVARYTKMKSLGEMLEHGLALFDQKTQTFAKHVQFGLAQTWQCPRGQAVAMEDGGTDYRLFATPLATVRVKAELETVARQSSYEAFTCLEPGSRWDKNTARVARDAQGRPAWAWRPDTAPVGQAEERELVAAGKIQSDEARYQVRDVDTGKPVRLHNGSIRYNAYRRRWVMIAVQTGGSESFLGEVWFAEAEGPTGPWLATKKIVTHQKYTIYNPVHHAFLDQEGGRLIHFEGTYANTFSGNPDATPRYDYNQSMYRLDLADPRLAPPKER